MPFRPSSFPERIAPPGVNPDDALILVAGDGVAIPERFKLATEFIRRQLTNEAHFEGPAKNLILPTRSDSANTCISRGHITSAEAIGTWKTHRAPYLNDMVNPEQSPWPMMIQATVFEGVIERARKAMRHHFAEGSLRGPGSAAAANDIGARYTCCRPDPALYLHLSALANYIGGSLNVATT